MKLLTKYNRINLLSTLVIFLLACTAFSLLIRYVLINQVDEDLKIEQNEIISYVTKYNRLPEIVKVYDQEIDFEAISQPAPGNIATFHSLSLYNMHEHEDELNRVLNFNINAGGQWYKATVSKSLEGTDDLIRLIFIITSITILLMLTATFLINRFVMRSLWQPFYNTLQSINNFKLGNSEKLNLFKTNIDEFALMNSTLQQALTKAADDYVVLKEFTENASHELQTPLAVIRSKLDLLIQDEHLTAQQSNTLQAAYEAIQKLSRMNQSLLLLTKIENRQFNETARLDFKRMTAEKINQFKEIWQNKNIIVTARLDESSVKMNVLLADVLLNNLLSNATKHNIDGGNINIHLKQDGLIVSNTGNAQPLNTNFLFTRFYKGSTANENHGLGLSIVKQIAEVSGIMVGYSFEKENTHTFLLKW